MTDRTIAATCSWKKGDAITGWTVWKRGACPGTHGSMTGRSRWWRIRRVRGGELCGMAVLLSNKRSKEKIW